MIESSEDDVVQLFDSYCRAAASVLAGWPQWKRHSLGSVEAEDQSDAGEQMAYDALERARTGTL